MTIWLLSWVVVNRVSRAHGRAEESSGTLEGVVTYHAIAGKMCRSHLVYKVKVHARPAACLVTDRRLLLIR